MLNAMAETQAAKKQRLSPRTGVALRGDVLATWAAPYLDRVDWNNFAVMNIDCSKTLLKGSPPWPATIQLALSGGGGGRQEDDGDDGGNDEAPPIVEICPGKGEWFVSTVGGSTISLWSRQSGLVRPRLISRTRPIHAHPLCQIVFSPRYDDDVSYKFVAVDLGGKVSKWAMCINPDVDSTPTATIDTLMLEWASRFEFNGRINRPQDCTKAAFTPSGDRIAIFCYPPNQHFIVNICDASTGNSLVYMNRELPAGDPCICRSLRFISDTKLLSFYNHGVDLRFGNDPGGSPIHLWDFNVANHESMTSLMTGRYHDQRIRDQVFALGTFSCDASDDGRQEMQTVSSNSHKCCIIAPSSVIASRHGDVSVVSFRIRKWSLQYQGGKLVEARSEYCFDPVLTMTITALELSPTDECVIVIGDNSGNIYLCVLHRKLCRYRVVSTGHDRVRQLRFTPDGKTLFVLTANKQIHIFSISSALQDLAREVRSIDYVRKLLAGPSHS